MKVVTHTFTWTEYRDLRRLARALGQDMPTLRTRLRRGDVVRLKGNVYGVVQRR